MVRRLRPALLTRRGFIRGSVGTAGLVASGCGFSPPLSTVSDEALSLHRDSLVLDLHVDTLLWTRLFGYNPALRHENRLPGRPFGFQMDLPRAREAGLDGAVMGLVINPAVVKPELIAPLRLLAWWEPGFGVEQSLESLDLLSALADQHPDEIAFVRKGSDIPYQVERGHFVALAGLEGAHGIEGDLANVERLYERGLRMVGLVHFQTTAAGHPMTRPEFYGQGLSDFGLELIEVLETRGIVVDLAHLNDAGVWDALSVMRRPCVVSHTACRAVHDHPRNLHDAQLRLIGRHRGVIGIATGRSFIGGGGLAGFLDHVEHALDVAGPHAVALGSDYDGFIVPEEGMGDVRVWPLVTHGLLERGIDPDVIEGVLGGNALRVLVNVCG